MISKTLSKQFDTDPGQAFLEVIRTAGREVNKKSIIETLVSAGVREKDAVAKWNKFAEFAKKHPHVRSKKGSTLYAWSTEPGPSAEALDVLESRLKSTPAWLVEALSTVIRDSLAHSETQGVNSQMTWSDRQGVQQARLIGEFAAAVEDCGLQGDPQLLAEWLESRVDASRLERLGKIGEVVEFDSDLHDATPGSLAMGAQVVITRPGYRWYGLDEPMVVVRARVRAE